MNNVTLLTRSKTTGRIRPKKVNHALVIRTHRNRQAKIGVGTRAAVAVLNGLHFGRRIFMRLVEMAVGPGYDKLCQSSQ